MQTLLSLGMLALAFLVVALFVYRHDAVVRAVVRLARVLPGGHRIWRRHPQPAGDSLAFPPAWEEALRRNMGHYDRLSPDEQKLLQDLVRDFIPSRVWVGNEGFEITDEVKATVAGQACLLLLGIREHDLYARVASIILHPGTFHSTDEGRDVLLGEAWYRGPVLLSWGDVLEGGRHPDGGSNVVYHEFAHQLDFEGLDAASALADATRADRRRWAEVMGREFAALVEATEHRRATLLDHYGATDPLEFFAVSTECFFERPIEMRATYPALYEVLSAFYGQDTAERQRRFKEGVATRHHKGHA